MAIEVQKNKVTRQEAEYRLNDLNAIQYVNLKSVDDVTQEWLDDYVKTCEREIVQLHKSYSDIEAKRFEIQVRDRITRVRSLCKTVFASREA